MVGIIIAFSVTNTLLMALNSPLLQEAFLSLSYGNRLKKLKGTVSTVKHLLLDAANKGELSHTIFDYVDKLKDAVYDADDLFDELVTKAQRKKLFDENVVEKVRQLFLSIKSSQKVRKLRLRLKNIADDHATFGLSISTKPHRRLRVETFSNVYAPDVVGRDGDANKVISMLLDSTVCVYFLAIVGIGGMGKTTLAKLVFGDKRITDEFPTRLWVCVSDQDGETFDVKQILSSILESLKCPFNNSSTVNSLQSECQRNLEGEKFLLVLDDIWSEKITELDNLKNLLKIDGSTSRIIATTRSKETARLIGNGIHELKGLSDEHSRVLFEMKAFGDGEKPPELVEIGEKIVKKSSNVPLAIMVIGSLLYGQPIGEWQTFETSGFNRFSKGMDEIMSILKMSYYSLDPSLKSCFAYCAVFPKNCVISKEMIINLWNAQGYIVPFDEGRSIDINNAGEEHFSVLLQRCFFQDVKKNELGAIESFKIHDLMHDLAQRVSGNEICMTNSSMLYPEYKVRHILVGNSMPFLSILSMPFLSILFNLTYSKTIDHSIVFNTTNKSKIRSYLMFKTSSNGERLDESPKVEMPKNWGWQATNRQDGVGDKLLTFEIPKNWGHLRALVLQNTNFRIPDTIGNLLHLRYLNLAHSNMKSLPDSIVKLYNLRTLNISCCQYLEEWPKEFSKLVNLNFLYRRFCVRLKCMPVGMSKLSHLRRLTEFVVADESAIGMQRVGQLKDLRTLAMTLKGCIYIVFVENFKSAERYDWEGSCLEGAQHLTEVEIHFHVPFESVSPLQDKEKGEKEEVVMEKMKPNPKLKRFKLSFYSGKKIARWGRAQDNWVTFLPNLVTIILNNCDQLQELPVFSKLPHLKRLCLAKLENLEYMEEEVTSNSDLGLTESGSLDATFFPSLETLELNTIQNLKRWWRSVNSNESHRQPAFPNLSDLIIYSCPRLMSFPPCLSLPKLRLTLNSKILRIRTADGEYASSSFRSTRDTLSLLRPP